jgi:hypothetical protein
MGGSQNMLITHAQMGIFFILLTKGDIGNRRARTLEFKVIAF